MESIAQETVEFLYEENGGIPKDLRLPTMDDVKAELGKFTISRVRKGSAVVVQRELPYARCGVRTMQKTQSLTGIVLDVDEVGGEGGERGGVNTLYWCCGMLPTHSLGALLPGILESKSFSPLAE